MKFGDYEDQIKAMIDTVNKRHEALLAALERSSRGLLGTIDVSRLTGGLVPTANAGRLESAIAAVTGTAGFPPGHLGSPDLTGLLEGVAPRADLKAIESAIAAMTPESIEALRFWGQPYVAGPVFESSQISLALRSFDADINQIQSSILRAESGIAAMSADFARSLERVRLTHDFILQPHQWQESRSLADMGLAIVTAARAEFLERLLERGSKDFPSYGFESVEQIAGLSTELFRQGPVGPLELEVSHQEAADTVAAIARRWGKRAVELGPAEPDKTAICFAGPTVIGQKELLEVAGFIRLIETKTGKAFSGGFVGWLVQDVVEAFDPNTSSHDRFKKIVRFLFACFVEAAPRLSTEMRDSVPAFFSEDIRNLRNLDADHSPEANKPAARIGEELHRRENALEKICGSHPIADEEWAVATQELLRKTCRALREYRAKLKW